MTDSQVEAQVENNAEGVQKLTDTKAIIAYLVEKFPLCFIAEGEAKPLKNCNRVAVGHLSCCSLNRPFYLKF